MTIQKLADEANWKFSQIATLSETKLAMLDEEAHFISNSIFISGCCDAMGPVPDLTIGIELYWAQQADVVLWPNPPAFISDHGILFDCFDEFLRWFICKLMTRYGYTPQEVDSIYDEIDGWRLKILCPHKLNNANPVTDAPLEADLELL